MTLSLRHQVELAIDRLALKLAKRAHALLDSGETDDLERAARLLDALARWDANRAASSPAGASAEVPIAPAWPRRAV